MSYCVIPGCQRPQNPEDGKVCQFCGSQLLLRGRYRSLKPLGEGGFGRTFLAIDQDIPSHPTCVIKQLYLRNHNPANYPKVMELFRQEAVRLDDLGHHAQIPELLAYFEQNRLFYLVQEFIDGQTLGEEMECQGAFTEPQVLTILHDLLTVLAFVHDQQIVHRDLKPANVIRRSSDRKLILIDFGIAKLMTGTNGFQTGTIIGSPEYMAPEQSRGKTVPASDLYSLGIIGIRSLTNLSPLDLFDSEHDRWIWQEHLPQGRRVSKKLVQVLNKLLQPAISQRYQSAREVLQDLEQSESSIVPLTRATAPAPQGMPISKTLPAVARSKIDYRPLQHLLMAGRWQQADELTAEILRTLLNKSIGGYIFSGDLEYLPCEDLQTLDQLWLKGSQKRFSFSVQAQIYQLLERDYWNFCDRVGWSRSPTPSTVQYQYSVRAPQGHLPSRQWLGGQQPWRHMPALATRLAQCGL